MNTLGLSELELFVSHSNALNYVLADGWSFGYFFLIFKGEKE